MHFYLDLYSMKLKMKSVVIFCIFSVYVCFGEPTSFTYDGIGYLSDVDSDSWMLAGRINKPKCIDIPDNLTLCRSIGYTKMRLPNLLNHDNINEVIQQSKSWVSLPRIGCHPDTQLFLCSLFSPVCLDRTIKPCRSLCERVKAGCAKRMLNYGYRWPDMVRCDKFPDDIDLCIQPLHNKTDDGTGSDHRSNFCEPCNQPVTEEGMLDNSCRSQFVVKVKIRKIRRRNNDKVLYMRKIPSKHERKYFIKTGRLTSSEKVRMAPLLIDGNECECDNLSTMKNVSYVMMGNKTNDGALVVTYLRQWKKKDRNFKRGIRKIKNFDCSKIVDEIEKLGENNPSPNRNRKGGKGGRRRRKNRNRNNPNKRKKPRRRRKKGGNKKKKNRRRPTSAPDSNNNARG